MAALAAAQCGARVVIVEKNGKIGRKLLATGNGRCNLSHRPVLAPAFYGNDRAFIEGFVRRWPTDALLAELAKLGLAFYEEDGRIYPRSQRADSVVELLTAQLRARRVQVVENERVAEISARDRGFSVMTQAKAEYCAPRLLLAAGGLAGPMYGSTGDFYGWLREQGHAVIAPRPVLAPFAAPARRWQRAQGQKADVRATLLADGRELLALTDEMLFTKTGLSGPLAMNLSAAFMPGRAHEMRIDFVPEMDGAQLGEWLATAALPLLARLQGLLPAKLAVMLLAEAACDGELIWSELPAVRQQALLAGLKNFTAPITGVEDYTAAKVTGGGVATTEIEPETLASRKVPGLYLAGEILDVAGLSGGHNLHFAFATGLQAGGAAASGAR